MPIEDAISTTLPLVSSKYHFTSSDFQRNSNRLSDALGAIHTPVLTLHRRQLLSRAQVQLDFCAPPLWVSPRFFCLFGKSLLVLGQPSRVLVSLSGMKPGEKRRQNF